MLFTATDNTRIDFTLPSDTALRRIIVDPDVKSVGIWLGNKCIEQLATYIKGAKVEQAFSTPDNLTTTVKYSSSIEPSTIWSDFSFPQVGEVANQARPGQPTGFHKIEKLDPLPISHYMTETESHMIEQWAGHVVEAVDPNTILPDAPVDGVGQEKVGRTRVIKREENDGEDDEDDEEDVSVNLPTQAPHLMNDALNSQFNAQKARFGRVRVMKLEEDEDEDEGEGDEEPVVGKVSGDSAREKRTWTYPPLPDSNTYSHRNMLSRKKPGRQRMVKVDSEDEDEDRGWGSPVRGNQQQEQPPIDWNDASAMPTLETRTNVENSNGWASSVHGYQQEQDLVGWGDDDSSTMPTLKTLDKVETSNDWDETIYPEISSYGAVNSSEKKQKPAQWEKTTMLPTDSTLGRHLEKKLGSITEEWGKFAVSESREVNGKQDNRRGRGDGNRRAEGHDIHQNARAPRAAQSHGRGRNGGRQDPQTPANQTRARPNTRGSRASKGGPPSGRGRGRGVRLARGGNKLGASASNDLVDISETEVVDPLNVQPPFGFNHNRGIDHQTAQAMPSRSNGNDATLEAGLIDISSAEVPEKKSLAPPPGFETSECGDTAPCTRSLRNHSSTASRHGNSSACTVSTEVPSIPNTGAYYVNTVNPGINILEMSRRRVEELNKPGGEGASTDASSEKLQEVDEPSTRTYHKTMNLQTKKPSPKKKVADLKRAELLKKAWGATGPPSQEKASGLTATSSSQKTETFEMSAAKKRLLRGKESMASSHPEAANEQQTVLQNDQFAAALMPVFKAARAFPGVLKFEIQLGQFLSPSPEGAYQPKCVTVNQWHKLYESGRGRLATARTFTNILTRNGADVDHILKLKIPGPVGSKLFQQDHPGRFGVRLEFHCQGKSNDDFKLVFDLKGNHEIERPFRKIAQVNLHVPGQIWDAAGMLTGSTQFAEEQALKDAADELAKSIFIPAGRKEIEISYRLPSSNEFAVKRVVMRRVSRHQCDMMERQDVQLQITEVQRLFVERRPGGRYLAFVSKYENMVQQMMIHFEMSLLSERIEQALSANAELTVGEITTAWTEDSLLQKSSTTALVEVMHMVVSKMDGVGSHNVGSAVFFLGRDSVLAGGSAVAIGSAVQNPTTKQATHNAQAVINVPGVRGGVAQPVSKGYALGYGGARIPIPGLAEADAVLPDDSASQVPASGPEVQGQVSAGFW